MDLITFGTDGWRSKIGDGYTFENVRRCAQGFAVFLKKEGRAEKGVVIGYDQRFQAEDFAAAAAEVMAGNGIKVFLTRRNTPTPTISYAVVDREAGGAINITASHNPPNDLGFKVRDPLGGAIPPADLKHIESFIPDNSNVACLDFDDARSDGLIDLFDPDPPYIAQLQRLVDLEAIREAGLSVLVDCMWGNGAGWFPRLMAGASTLITEVHNRRNPIFPHMTRPEPIPPNVDHGLSFVRTVGADVAIINDGDADRLGIGDENGHFIDQLRVYGLLGYYFLEVRGERGPIVKTISTTKMLNKLAQLYDVPVYETGVGFKYIAPKMVEVGAMIGGEESGGYAFRNHVPERDGILAGLYMLDMMVKTGKKPTELLELLFEKVGPHYYDRIDSRFDQDRKEEILANVNSARPRTIGGLKCTDIVTIDGHQFMMEDGGWLLVRFSGTEPIIRVYCETTQEDRVEAILEDGLRIAGLKQPATAVSMAGASGNRGNEMSRAIQDYYPDDVAHCYGCGTLNDHGLKIKTYWDGDQTVTRFRPQPYHIAIPGYVYGGLIASLIDCHATGTAAAALYREEEREMDSEPYIRCLTASLHVDYLRPTPVNSELVVRGQVDKIDGHRVTVSCSLFAGNLECARGEVVAVRVPESYINRLADKANT